MLSDSLRLFCRKFRHDVVDGMTTEQAADSALSLVRTTFLEESVGPIANREEAWKPVGAILDAFRICLIGWPVYRVDGVIGWDATRFPECFEASDPTRNPDDPHPIPESLKDERV